MVLVLNQHCDVDPVIGYTIIIIINIIIKFYYVSLISYNTFKVSSVIINAVVFLFTIINFIVIQP